MYGSIQRPVEYNLPVFKEVSCGVIVLLKSVPPFLLGEQLMKIALTTSTVISFFGIEYV